MTHSDRPNLVTRLRRVVSTASQTFPRQLNLNRKESSGVNLISYENSSFGLGYIGRVLERALDDAGVDRHVLPYRSTFSPSQHRLHMDPRGRRIFHTTLSTVINADHVFAAIYYPRYLAPTQHRVAMWWWETNAFTSWQRLGIRAVDELWVGSTFQEELFGGLTRKPISVFPIPIDPPPPPQADIRRRIGIDDRYWFGFQFDWSSSGQRKNVMGLVNAFRKAFTKNDSTVGLLIKSRFPSADPISANELARVANQTSNIKVISDDWPLEINEQFPYMYDCYVSLHRVEGYGLTLAAAMSAGKPVIATGYSGNLEFMNEDNSYLVPYRLTEITADPIYPSGGVWAEPDESAAIDLMRLVAADPDAARAIGSRGHSSTLSHTRKRTSDWILHNLQT